MLKRERFFVSAFLLCIVLPVVRAVDAAWTAFLQNAINNGALSRPAVLYAPNAYRVAMPALLDGLVALLHTRNWMAVNAALDGVFLSVALWLGYLLAVRNLALGSKARIAALLLYLALLQFPAAWIVPWQRAETTPTAAFLLFGLFALSRLPRGRGYSIALLAATLLQSFVRSDVPLVFGVSICALALAGMLNDLGPRFHIALVGTGVALLAAGAQGYLQYVRFPHLSYPPDTPVVMLAMNLRPSTMVGFAVVLLPFLITTGFALASRKRMEGVERVALFGAGIYVCLLTVVASLREVRLFVPYLMALCVVAARWMGGVFAED